MRLTRLELRNFKGQRGITIDANGEDLSVYGDNAAGKTTLADAAFWLLFGKDSANRKDFGIKTTDKDNQPIHHLEHEVSGLFDLNGERLELRKVYHEVWTKPRGTSTAVFDGHETDHFINTVPVPKGEYERRIAGICDESRFRLLTDPTYFNVQMKWQDRRKVLIEVCGDVTDADVIASCADLTDLPSILGSHSLEDYRKILQASRKKLNETISGIAPRIDEVSRKLNEVIEVPDVAPLRTQLTALNAERARIASGGQIAELTKQLREFEGQAQEIKNRLAASAGKDFEKAQADLRAAETAVFQVEQEIQTLTFQIEQCQSARAQIERERDLKREEFGIENAKTLPEVANDTCAACGQALPADKVEETRRLATEQFNERKARVLEGIRAAGISLKEKSEALDEKIAAKQAQIAKLAPSLEAKVSARDALKVTCNAAKPIAPEEDESYRRNLADQEILRRDIRALEDGTQEKLREKDNEILALSRKIADAEAAAARLAEQSSAQKRIEELLAEEKGYATEIERVDHELFLTDLFVKTKVALLTDRINSRFRLARFRLFDTQINGAINEVCEVTFDGVAYSDLNHGARVNVGLDIIDTLADHYGFAPFIVIDNAESVTRILPTAGQQIRLVVSEPDKNLRVVLQPRATAQEEILAS